MDAFDADVLIYAAVPEHPLGRRVRGLFGGQSPEPGGARDGVGSVLLVPELLIKPSRGDSRGEALLLAALLGRLELRPVDEASALLAVTLGAAYGLRMPDAVHLATAVSAGADRFVTNNRRDFKRSIVEIDVTYPTDLPDVAS